MKTSYQIFCDYSRAIIKANSLDAVANKLVSIAHNDLTEEMQSMAAHWESDSMMVMTNKSIEIETIIIKRAQSLRRVADTIRRIARRNYNAEMKALELAKNRGYHGGAGRSF